LDAVHFALNEGEQSICQRVVMEQAVSGKDFTGLVTASVRRCSQLSSSFVLVVVIGSAPVPLGALK
jgi:hypothetical protein